MAGTRIHPSNYFWRDGVTMTAGLEAQARGDRFQHVGRSVVVASERAARMRGPIEVSPQAAQFQRFRPPWA